MQPLRIAEITIIGMLGGFLSYSLSIPLPWVLGPFIMIIIWKNLRKRSVQWPSPLKNSSLTILGIYFGLYFSLSSLQMIVPYLFPYVFITICLIIISIMIGLLLSKWLPIDSITSVFSTIPGGLTEMVIASEDMKANSSYVLIFQTIRLITVLFTVPTIAVLLFTSTSSEQETIVTVTDPVNTSLLTYSWFVIPVAVGFLFKNKIPAGIVLIPMLLTVAINITMTDLPPIPEWLLIIAQLSVGISLAQNISIKDIKSGGAYCIPYFLASLLIIGSSFALGIALAIITGMDHATALLSIAPGGLIEMGLTASSVGGDPAIVTSLQMVRILIIITIVPITLKWFFTRTLKKHNFS